MLLIAISSWEILLAFIVNIIWIGEDYYEWWEIKEKKG